MHKSRVLLSVILVSLILSGSTAQAGLGGTLDKELTSLIEETKPYLVTVKGDGSWRNLIATGIVYTKDGYVITSSPAFNASDFEVTFAGGETYKAEAIGADHETGLAILKIKGEREFNTPEWGSPESVKEGDWVLFVGNSYDKPSSVNIGSYGGKDDEGFLELNLNVSPGSSGGAVLNTEGEVIGIMVALEFSHHPTSKYLNNMNFGDYRIFNRSGRSNETALALPIDRAKIIAAELVEHGKIRRGFLGISQRNLTGREKDNYDLDAGVVITDIVSGSPAEGAGLREDDIITRIDGKKIEDTGDLYYIIRSRKPGDEINVTYIRNGKEESVEVELSESMNDYFLGSLDFDDISPKALINKKLNIPDSDELRKQMEKLAEEMDKLRQELEDLKSRFKD